MKSKKSNLSNWTNENRDLLRNYKGEYIAYNESGLIAHSKTLKSLMTKAEKVTKNYFYYYVSPYMDKIRILPIHFKKFTQHEWPPYYHVELKSKRKKIKLPMLIDSGADCSVISYQTGISLGLSLAENEALQEAYGVGKNPVEYVARNIEITIDGKTMKVPVAWMQNEEATDEIIGREVVFDKFDIEFKQADEQIIFKWRG